MGPRVVTAVLGVLVAGLSVAAAQGMFYAAGAGAVAALIFVLAVAGRERTAVLLMAGAFATAPMYRGIAGDLPLTPTDLLIVLAVLMLLPELLTRRLRIPPLFLAAVGVLFALGLRGAAVAPEPAEGVVLLGQWILVIAVLPIVVAAWQPSPRVIALLLWSFLAGHGVSIVVGLAEGPLVNNRYDGLTHHPNAFGIAGAISIGAVLYLWPKSRSWWVRAALACAVIGSLGSVLMSGSRAATVVVAAIAIMVPVVERSAVAGLLLAAVAGLGVAFLPFVVDASGEGSSITRLVGDGTSEFSDNLREDAIDDGMDMVAEAPFLGSGLSVELGEIHHVYLEVTIAVGLIGALAYLAMLFVLAKPLIGSHPERRLAYLVWVFIIIGPAVPGINDRTMLLPMSLAILPAVGAITGRRTPMAAAPEPAEPAEAAA